MDAMSEEKPITAEMVELAKRVKVIKALVVLVIVKQLVTLSILIEKPSTTRLNSFIKVIAL